MSGPKTTSYAFVESQRQAAERAAQRARELAEEQRQEEERQHQALQAAIRDARERGESLIEAVRQAQTQFPDEGLVVQWSPPGKPGTQTKKVLTMHLAELSRSVTQAETQLQLETQRTRANIAFREVLATMLPTSAQNPRTAAEALAVSPDTPAPTPPPNKTNRLLERLEREP
ncbi:hypothetical protein CCP4SC76_1080010 [Gammaproteobacteria bacterium]